MRTLALVVLVLMAVQQSTTGRVEIMVRDANTREGVPGVPVTLTFRYPNEPTGPTTTLVTDPRGLAAFSALGEGMYRIKLGEAFKPRPFTEYVLLDPGDQKRIEIGVDRIANVNIRVLDQNGEPLKNALVTLPSLTYVNGRRTLKEVPGIRHNADGAGGYVLTGVPSGEYYLRIEHPELPVRDSPEAPPRDAYFPGVLDFAAATRVTVRGDDLFLGEIKLPLQRVFAVSGTVVNPVPGAEPLSPRAPETTRVTSFSVEPVSPASFVATMAPRIRYIPGSDPSEVSFELDGLTPGTYALYPAFVSMAEAATLTRRTLVTISDRNIEGLRIVLERRIRAAVRVTVNGESSRIPETLRFGLVAKDPLPPLLDASSTPIYVPDPQTGRFELTGMVEGIRYALRVSGLPADAYVADIRTGSRSIVAEGSFVAQAAQEPIEVQIGTQGATIQGVVRDAEGQPVTNAAVALVPDFAKRKSSFLYRRATTNSEGQFSVRGLAPGDYQVFAWPSAPPQGAEEDPAFLAPFETRGTTIRATPSLTTETNLRLIQ